MDPSFLISQVFGPIIMSVANIIVTRLIPGNHASNKRFRARVKRIVKRCKLSGLILIDLLLAFMLYRKLNFSHPITPVTSLDVFKIIVLTYSARSTCRATIRSILR
jgi:hypothetical protein